MPKLAPLVAVRPVPREPSGGELRDPLTVVAGGSGAAPRRQRGPRLARSAAVRVSAAGASSTDARLARLRDHLAEPWRPLERLPIEVSRFFRDPEAFEILGRRAVPELRARRRGGELRAWSVGCASGHEAYSLGMLLAGSGGPWSVLGTDVDRSALTRARAAVYPRSDAADVPPRLAAEHLAPAPGGAVRVALSAARGVVFAAHDVGAPVPPPGGPFDVVACRNVLVYCLPASRAEVLGRVVARIAPGGWLLLGEAEWPAPAVERRLEVVDRTHRLFRVRLGPGRAS